MKRLFFLLLTIVSVFNCCTSQEPTTLVYNKAGIPLNAELTIDSIVNDAISKRAMPGCRVLAVVKNHVVFNKSYGYFTYDSIKPVNDSTLYDLASVTKIAASSLVLMKLYEDKKIDLDKPLTYYFNGITDNGATLRDALAHQAGFKPWLDIRRANKDLSKSLIDDPIRYNPRKAKKQITKYIISQPLDSCGRYLYSDLGFYLYTLFPKKYYNKDFEVFLYEKFYRPLGTKMYFKPYYYYDKQNIAPTENDTVWRKRVVCGFVHDEGAFLMGGVSGHAGLFATAGDMAVLMQMLLNKGSYGGYQYLKPETVELFTSQAFDNNRRGLVFDKQLLDLSLNGTPSKLASYSSYGHSGFTGTFAWADPQNELIFIFLCNSTFPNRSTMLSKLDVRSKIHDIFYHVVDNGLIEYRD